MTPTIQIVPYGFCHCRCGGKTALSPQTYTRIGIRRGEPQKFIFGHQRKIRPVIEKAKPFKMDGVYCRLIALTSGQYAIVWESRYKELMQWKWTAEWCEDTQSYYAIRATSRTTGRKKVSMHRQILGLDHGNPLEGDHINCVTLDCRDDNLRVATHAENTRNRRAQRGTLSGVKCVHYSDSRSRWIARICYGGRQHYIGSFKTPQEASSAYFEAAKKHYGVFARQG